jgi:hypothetical protein
MIHTIIDYPTMEDNSTKLTVIHNAGFFSCSSIALMDIMIYFNQNKRLPDIVDRSQQYGNYKSFPMDNIIPFYFREVHTRIAHNFDVSITPHPVDFQFADYKDIFFALLAPFIYKFFTPSEHVRQIVSHYEWKYHIDYENTCAIFYRGNDKNRETTIGGYDEFIQQALAVRAEQPNIKFLVQPDETEFLEYCIDKLGNDSIICFEETPHMRKCDSAMFFELPMPERAEYGAKFFAAVLCISRCRHLITHSGNGGFWAVVYRGHGHNVRQFLNDGWL